LAPLWQADKWNTFIGGDKSSLVSSAYRGRRRDELVSECFSLVMMWEKKRHTLSFLCWVSGQACEGTVSGSASFSHHCIQVCAWESLWESVCQYESQMGIQTSLAILPSPDQRSAGQSRLASKALQPAISVARITQGWNVYSDVKRNRDEMKPNDSICFTVSRAVCGLFCLGLYGSPWDLVVRPSAEWVV